MRIPRIKLSGQTALYHCVSRVVGAQYLFGVIEKEKLRKMIWAQADFCGLEVLSYCVMSNHFHILVRVPERIDLEDSELVARVTRFYGAKHPIVKDLNRVLAEEGKIPGCVRDRLLARMGDLSCFIKELKQRFSVWFNRLHDRFGTLWAERFRSTLVEDVEKMRRVMAAYIDLNPVRAGIVKDPKDYRFCNYAEAVGGGRLSRLAIGSYCGGNNWTEVSKDYREYIFVRSGVPGQKQKVVLDRDTILKELAGGTQLGAAMALRLRVRYFCDGVAIGSASYLNEIFRDHRDRFGKSRKSGARQICMGLRMLGFKTIRDLRREVCS